MISKNVIKIVANEIALQQRDKIVNKIGESLRSAFKDERISQKRVERILERFVEELKKENS